jgi:hypothetical protein
MLDKKVQFSTSEGFEPLPMGVYTVQITDVNLKKQLAYHSTEEEEVLLYEFSILDEGKIEDGSELRGRKLWHKCRLALSEKSWMYKLAKAANGRDMTPEDKDTFDPESLVGKQVTVMVEQKPSKDGTKVWNNIISFDKVKKALEPVADEKGVSVAPATTTKSVVEEKAENTEEVDAEIALLEAQAALAAKKAAAAKKK